MASTEGKKTSRLVCKIMAVVFIGTYMPKIMFTPVYYQQIGLSSTQIGVIHSSMRFSNAIGGLILGYAADRFDMRKSIFVMSSVVYAAMPVLITLPQPNYLCAGKAVDFVDEYISYTNGTGSTDNGRQPRSGPRSNHNNHSSNDKNNVYDVENNNNDYNNYYDSNNNNYNDYDDDDKNNNNNFHDVNRHENDNNARIVENNNPSNNNDHDLNSNSNNNNEINNNVNNSNKNIDNNENSDDDKFHHFQKSSIFADGETQKRYVTRSSDELVLLLVVRYLNSKRRQNVIPQVIKATHSNLKPIKNNISKSNSNVTIHSTETNKKELLNQSNSELQNVFITLLLMIIIGELIDGASIGLMDTLLVNSVDDKRDYPRLRLWGSIGQGVIVPFLALGIHFNVVNICGVRVHDTKLAMYIMTGISCIGVFVIIFKVYFPSSKIERETNKETKADSLKDLITPLANWSLFVNALFYGILTGTTSAFLLLTMTNVDPDHAELSMAIAIISRNFIAFLVYLVAPQLLRAVGYGAVMTVSYLFFASGFLVVAFMETVWLGILAESLEVTAYALAWSSCVSYIGEIAHPSLAVTAQSILHFMLSGIGPSIGPLIAGVILDRTGRKTTFCIFSAIAIIAMIFSITVQLVLWRRSQEYQPLGYKDSDINNGEDRESDY